MSETEDKWRFANTLVKGYPQEAAKFIAEHSDPNKLRQRVEISRFEQHDIAIEQRQNPFNAPLPWDRRHPGNAPSVSQADNQIPSLHPHPDRYPPSPPSTTSAGKSSYRNTKLRNIIAFNIDHKEEPLSVREHSGAYHLIREQIVYDRLGFNPDECPDGRIFLQYNGRISVSQQVSLTWIHNGASSSKTHKGLFYLVADLPDVDVLLGTNEEGHPLNATRGPTSDAGLGGLVQPVPRRPGLPHPSFRQPKSESYHASSDYTVMPASNSSRHGYGSGPSHAPAERPGRSTPDDRLSGPGRQMTGSPIGESIRSASPGNASNMSHSSRLRGQTPSNFSTASSTLSESSQNSDVLRIEFVWDDTHRKCKLDLGAGGEHFFLALRQYFIPFERTLERTNLVLFIAEIEGARPKRYGLSLDESDLHEDFETVVEWIKGMRSNHPLKKFRAIIQD